MRYVAAYLLVVLGGKVKPTIDDIKGVLKAVDAPIDEDKLKKFFDQVSGKDIETLLTEGQTKLATIPSAGSASGPGTSDTGAKKEEKKEEKKVEEKKPVKKEESESEDALGDIFGF